MTSEQLPAREVSAPAFWEDLYARRSDRWELGGPTPPLVEYLHRHPPPPPGRVAIPGCGRGHDARLLARRRYRVWGFDFATPAIREARDQTERAGLDVVFEQRDVFGLAADYPGFFDGLWEYTSFCAVDPARRAEYAAMVRAILKPGGWLLACFFPMRRRAAGPPYPVSEREVRRLFARRFRIERAWAPRSVRPRQGQEWMVLLRNTNAPA